MEISGENPSSGVTPETDPRLQATPDYGTLGPGSDVKMDVGTPGSKTIGFRPIFKGGAAAAVLPTGPQVQARRPGAKPQLVVAAIGLGIALAMPLIAMGGMQSAWERVQDLLSLHGKPEAASPAILSDHELEKLDRQPAQKQAELLLERALNHYEGASDQLAARVDAWHGRLKMTPNLRGLVDAALNSNDLRVRGGGN